MASSVGAIRSEARIFFIRSMFLLDNYGHSQLLCYLIKTFVYFSYANVDCTARTSEFTIMSDIIEIHTQQNKLSST